MEEKSSLLIYGIFGICLFLVVVSLFHFFGEDLLDVKEFDVKFAVVSGDGVGVDVNTSVLSFGKTSPGGSSIVRRIHVFNDYSFPIKVNVYSSKNIADFLVVNSTFNVGVGENFTLPVSLSVPLDAELGNYTGKIRLELYESE